MEKPFYSKRARVLLIIAGFLFILTGLWLSYKGHVWSIPVGVIGGAVFTSPIADWYYYKK